MQKYILVFLFLYSSSCFATDLSISQPILYKENGGAYAVFNLKWSNAWHNDRNHDAVWLVNKLKQPQGNAHHISVAQNGHQVVDVFQGDGAQLSFKVPEDGVGLFVYPPGEFRGDIEVRMKIILNAADFAGINTRNASFSVHGIEMVMIPAGGYYLGDPLESAREFGAIYQPNGNLIQVNSEDDSFEIGPEEDLYYEAPDVYKGDQKGSIPAAYPKGVDGFWIMKYEISEGHYVDFLNKINTQAQAARNPIEARNYNGNIQLHEGQFLSPTPSRAANFISWDDAMAYADWTGLRPMTELEFTKAARGPVKPESMDYPWGTDPKLHVQRLPGPDGVLSMNNGWDESKLSDETKKYFGASYYWVMDLAGSLWERLVTIGHEKGRSYQGRHGDGKISAEGSANIEDWPIEAEESGGIGFRGGGFYGYGREYTSYNPFSPISYRPYGGWHGGMRSVAYGTRFVRTLD